MTKKTSAETNGASLAFYVSEPSGAYGTKKAIRYMQSYVWIRRICTFFSLSVRFFREILLKQGCSEWLTMTFGWHRGYTNVFHQNVASGRYSWYPLIDQLSALSIRSLWYKLHIIYPSNYMFTCYSCLPNRPSKAFRVLIVIYIACTNGEGTDLLAHSQYDHRDVYSSK